MEAVPTTVPADVVHGHISGDYRYRVARTPMGFLITARSRDVLGLVLTEQWLHQHEDSAMACMHAVVASHSAWRAMGTTNATGALSAMEKATAAHTEVCKRLGDDPLVGREVQELRESLLSDEG